MKVGQIGPTFIFPVKTVTFYWVESLVTSSILKMRKSHKKLAPVYALLPTCVYANTWQGGLIRPPPPWIGLISSADWVTDWPLEMLIHHPSRKRTWFTNFPRELQMRQQQFRNIGEWQFQNCNAVFIHRTNVPMHFGTMELIKCLY